MRENAFFWSRSSNLGAGKANKGLHEGTFAVEGLSLSQDAAVVTLLGCTNPRNPSGLAIKWEAQKAWEGGAEEGTVA